MGSYLEINDTLQITTAQGFPADLLALEKHRKDPITIEAVKGRVFAFAKKSGARIFQLDPVRVFLVHNIDGKWLYWGKVLIQWQRIDKKFGDDGNWTEDDWETSGTYVIVDIYEPAYQEAFTRRESPKGQSYFGDQ